MRLTASSGSTRRLRDVAGPTAPGARRRGDGRLTHDLDPHDLGPQDACGVFGVWAPGEDVAKLTYFGLYALQHRGQESAGIAVSNGRQILVYKDMGLVSQVFDESTLEALKGHLAIGHSRYSTTGASTWAERPADVPADGRRARSRSAHNGNLTNTRELQRAGRRSCRTRRGELDFHARNLETTRPTTPAWSRALLAYHPDTSLEERAVEVLPQLRGAFSFVWMDEDTLYAARDPQGIRPLVLGRLERGWVVASETAALDIVGASYVREIEPGELIAIDEHGLRTPQLRRARRPRAACSSTSTSPAPTPLISGQRVHSVAGRDRPPAGPRVPGRRRPGDPGARVRHARPRSATPRSSGIPYGPGLVKNSYVGRTFIQPSARPSASSASGSSSTRCAT